jgi:hypothetical protein
MEEKRGTQRRSYGAVNVFPFTDTSGCVVIFDRSRLTDRRLNNLKLEELEELEAEEISTVACME